MTDVMRICAAALLVGISAFILRELGWRGAVAFSIFGAVVFLSLLSDGLSRLTGSLAELSANTGVTEITKEILKVVGVSYLFGICADICSDLGEKTLSSALTVVGRVEILLIAMPYFFKITEQAIALMK